MTKATNADRSMANILAREKQFRATGRWPEWRWHDIDIPPGPGWARQAKRVTENGLFVVMFRDVQTEWGPMIHAWIRTAAQATDLTWAEKQRIKDEVFGRERTAIEVFPPRSELVDAADLFHLWVFPPGFSLPFTLADRNKGT